MIYDALSHLSTRKLLISLYRLEKAGILEVWNSNHLLNKVPGIGGSIKLQKTKLDLSFSETFKDKKVFGGYERLILEAVRGNPTLFLSREEIEQAGHGLIQYGNAWEHQNEAPKPYPAGSWGASFIGCLVSTRWQSLGRINASKI